MPGAKQLVNNLLSLIIFGEYNFAIYHNWVFCIISTENAQFIGAVGAALLVSGFITK